jgi:uncharacterized protein (DUF2141 family)
MTRTCLTICATIGVLSTPIVNTAAWAQTSPRAQAPGRDAAKPAPTGTAVIAGTVVNDDSASQPVRRVRVWIASSDRQITRTTVSDDAGRFSFSGLPAGRYSLSATKQGYVNFSYGARRANRPGIALVLGDDQQLTGLSLRLVRGSVITGTLVDQNGEPFSGANVNAMRHAFAGTGRTLVPAGSSQTDDRGQYRIWGLPAGDYIVSATVGFLAAARPDMDIARVTDADVKRALGEIGGAARPSPAVSTATSTDARASASRTVGYAPVFYPGTFVAVQATPVKLGIGEERTGIDFSLSLVPTAKVEGTVVVPEGINAPSLMVQMIGNNPQGLLLDTFRRSTPTSNGNFAFAGVPPGSYTIAVRAIPPAKPGARMPAAPPPGPTHWAMADVTVDGRDISGVSMTLQPGLTVSGTLEFEGTTAPPDRARFRVNLVAVQAPGEVSVGAPTATPDANGAFTIAGVTPGRYRLMASFPTPRPDTTWQLKSSMVAGRDTLDAPIDLREGTDGAVITFTDRVSELTGIIQDAAGQPAPEYHVVVFSADKSHWGPQSRRIRSVRPGADGKYLFANLPPGDYLLTAVTDIEPGEWFDPALLDQLARASIKVSLAEGEKKSQDLRLAAQ